MKKNIIVSLLLSIVCVLIGCTAEPTTQPPTIEPIPVISAEPTEQPISELTVHFVDVGQADAAILRCDDDTMIIDGGNVADSSLIVVYLKKLNIDAIDYMICTHAHEDHVGGLSAPLSVMHVGAVYATTAESNSKAYQTFKQKVADQNSEIMHPENYERLSLGSATAEILASPTSSDTAKNENIQTNETAIEYDEGTYIGNKNSKKLHRPDCYALPAEKNRIAFTSRADAINAGYLPCGNCQP